MPYITDPGIQFDSEIDKNVFDETQRMTADQSDIFSSPFKPHTQPQRLGTQSAHTISPPVLSPAQRPPSQTAKSLTTAKSIIIYTASCS